MVANCFRYAAFIFLHSILDRIATLPTTSFNSHDTFLEDEDKDKDKDKNTTIWNTFHLQISLSKSQALNEIMTLLHTYPPDDHSEYSALTFPLFIAGCECDGDEEQLSSIYAALKTLEVNFGIRNTIRAQELIRLYWSDSAEVSGTKRRRKGRRRRHWLDLLEDLDWDLLLV